MNFILITSQSPSVHKSNKNNYSQDQIPVSFFQCAMKYYYLWGSLDLNKRLISFLFDDNENVNSTFSFFLIEKMNFVEIHFQNP